MPKFERNLIGSTIGYIIGQCMWGQGDHGWAIVMWIISVAGIAGAVKSLRRQNKKESLK